MKPTNRSISELFSQGKFSSVYEFFSEDMEWNIVGNTRIKGKQSVVDFCSQMMIEMESAVLTNDNIIEAGNQIVIEGKCSYFNAGGQKSFVNYCDIYSFEGHAIKRIHSYCIEADN